MAVPTPGPVRVVYGHAVAFRRLWRLNVVSSFLQPVLYLLGLGVGVGALVDRNTSSTEVLGSIPYVAFVAPGLLVATAMTVCADDSMWPVMGGLRWQRLYHGIAATPLGPRDIVIGHALWMAIRGGLATGAVALALALFPDTRSWGLLPAVVVAMIVGVAFAMPIMAVSVGAEVDGVFPAIQRFVLIPLFLFGGAFYPLEQLPEVVGWLVRVAPLWHGIVVAREFTAGDVQPVAAAGHLAYAALWALVGGWIAVRRLAVRLCP